MEEKQKENIEKLSAGFEKKRRDGRVLSARPVSSPNDLNHENIERPYGKSKYEQKRAAEVPVIRNGKGITKESDATVIREKRSTQFRKVTHKRTGEVYHAPFPLELNPMPVQENTKDINLVATPNEEKL